MAGLIWRTLLLKRIGMVHFAWARQLKVRDLSETILIDFINMPKEHETTIEETTKHELQKDKQGHKGHEL
ncbi:ribonuclease E/G [Niallia taxi]|nr:ribonuclease E/G [Niallia taxi]MDE5052246.1 ribonuclease E/G [Niallia taxi]